MQNSDADQFVSVVMIDEAPVRFAVGRPLDASFEQFIDLRGHEHCDHEPILPLFLVGNHDRLRADRSLVKTLDRQ